MQTIAVDTSGGRWFGSGFLVTSDLELTVPPPEYDPDPERSPCEGM
ncbi:hypothetical protein [Catenulispora yoronensis]